LRLIVDLGFTAHVENTFEKELLVLSEIDVPVTGDVAGSLSCDAVPSSMYVCMYVQCIVDFIKRRSRLVNRLFSCFEVPDSILSPGDCSTRYFPVSRLLL
jgi:hypothetical protein